MMLCSATRRSAFGLILSASLGLAACGNGSTDPAGKPPTPGNIGDPAPATADAPAAPVSPAEAPPGPRAEAPVAPGAPLDKGSADGAVVMPAEFTAKTFCLMPKLSHCSAYGAKYNKLDAVSKFCGSLGGEETTYCPSSGVVARCRTPADVLTYYYSTGEKPYTKDAAEAKCAERGWEVLP